MLPEELIIKAERAIASAKILYEANDAEGACNRAYYAMFDAARAILLAKIKSISPTVAKTHSGLISAFSLHLVKTGIVPSEYGQALNRAHDLRLVADYTGDFIEAKDVVWMIEQAKDFVKMMKKILAEK